MPNQNTLTKPGAIPSWVPLAAQRYIAHTEGGVSIRALARQAGCHASTVLRQVRRVETRRDDPLIDAALRRLGKAEDSTNDTAMTVQDPPAPDALEKEARSILRKLCETGAVLAVAQDMDKAVVVRDLGEGESLKTAVVDSAIAQAMALKDWIACAAPGRISRYRITALGRSTLSHLLAEHENRLRGFSEAQTGFERSALVEHAMEELARDPAKRAGRCALNDSPLVTLSRRRDHEGGSFLDASLVAAGERLREEFELAQSELADQMDWAAVIKGRRPALGKGAPAAAHRFAEALSALGPGLGDIALRCCCYMEGLEVSEKDLNWSARSGKIVLRIALQRLKRHYAEQACHGGDLIG